MRKHLSFLTVALALCISNCKKPEVKSTDAAISGNLKTNTLPTHPNVLFIVVDDLRWWSIHKLWQLDTDRQADNIEPQTPCIDALMNNSVTFARAYAPGVECAPSRTAFLTGLSPNYTGVYRVGNQWWNGVGVNPNQTIIKRFIGNSTTNPDYLVYGAGKVYHQTPDNQLSDWWFNRPYINTISDVPAGATTTLNGNKPGYVFNVLSNADSVNTGDNVCVNKCLDYLDQWHSGGSGKPFFIACGLRKPHSPLVVPQKYFNLYSSTTIKTPQVVPASLANLPPMAKVLANNNGCGANTPSPDDLQSTDPTYWKNYLQSYMGCVSFIDAQIGRLIHGLKQLGTNQSVYNNTIIVLISDHGVHFGEKHHVHKTTLWEETTRTPMIWHIPGVNPGTVCNVPVSIMDLYPTLGDYCNLISPPHASQAHGLRTFLENPGASATNHYVLTTMNNKAGAVRSSQYRLIQYDADTGKEELYDEANDPWEGTDRRGNPPTGVLPDMRSHLPSATEYEGMVSGDPSCD